MFPGHWTRLRACYEPNNDVIGLRKRGRRNRPRLAREYEKETERGGGRERRRNESLRRERRSRGIGRRFVSFYLGISTIGRGMIRERAFRAPRLRRSSRHPFVRCFACKKKKKVRRREISRSIRPNRWTRVNRDVWHCLGNQKLRFLPTGLAPTEHLVSSRLVGSRRISLVRPCFCLLPIGVISTRASDLTRSYESKIAEDGRLSFPNALGEQVRDTWLRGDEGSG